MTDTATLLNEMRRTIHRQHREIERLRAALWKVAYDAEVAHQGGLHSERARHDVDEDGICIACNVLIAGPCTCFPNGPIHSASCAHSDGTGCA